MGDSTAPPVRCDTCRHVHRPGWLSPHISTLHDIADYGDRHSTPVKGCSCIWCKPSERCSCGEALS